MSFFSEVQPEDGFAPFVAVREWLGFIPNLLQAQTLLPRVAEAQVLLENALRFQEGAISRVQRERILFSIAADRRDAYLMALDRAVLASLGVSDRQIDDLLTDYRNAGLSAQDLASLQFCLKLARYALSVSREDIEALRAQGMRDEAILEAVLVTALAVYRHTLSAGLRPKPDFALREFPVSNSHAFQEQLHHRISRDARGPAPRKGPYLPAPYLSTKTFAPFDLVRESHGFIPGFFRAQTLRSDLLGAELEAIAKILLPSDVLTRMQKECILLAVSAANLNSYCVAVHCNLLRGLGMPPEEGDQIAVDHHEANLPEADTAMLDFAVKLGTRGSDVCGDDIARLRRLGFTDQQILECEVVTALNNFANTLQMGLGIEPDFEPPSLFEENKMHLRAAEDRPIKASSSSGVPDADAELVAEAQEGKLEAFEELVRRHSQLIYRSLVAILGDPTGAQDAMQEALFSAFKHIRSFEGRSKFSTWLVSIARNTALQQLRGRKNVESLDETDDDENPNFRPRQVRDWQEDPEQFYSSSEIRQLVERGILGLPSKYRVVVMLRDIEQRSTDEVARQLGLSVPAVKVRLLRGRLMLREWLSPHMTTAIKKAAR